MKELFRSGVGVVVGGVKILTPLLPDVVDDRPQPAENDQVAPVSPQDIYFFMPGKQALSYLANLPD